MKLNAGVTLMLNLKKNTVMTTNNNQGFRPMDELPSGMFTKMLAASVASVVGLCLLALAFFS
jgi:hypothetical protein